MTNFFVELFGSIFTPGPTPTLLVATNVSFAALQLVLLTLLIGTYSIHFVVLSLLCAGLWFSINWFVNELQAANAREDNAKRSRRMKDSEHLRSADDSGTETEGTERLQISTRFENQYQELSRADVGADALRQRQSLGEISTGRSTDSEWEKVSDRGESQT